MRLMLKNKNRQLQQFVQYSYIIPFIFFAECIIKYVFNNALNVFDFIVPRVVKSRINHRREYVPVVIQRTVDMFSNIFLLFREKKKDNYEKRVVDFQFALITAYKRFVSDSSFSGKNNRFMKKKNIRSE